MKLFYVAALAFVLTACGSKESANGGEEGGATSEQANYEAADKFIGKWHAENAPTETINIVKAPDFDKTHNCVVNDGKTELSFNFLKDEKLLRLRQPEYWVQILHDEAANQLLWKIVHYDETEGKVVKKYIFQE